MDQIGHVFFAALVLTLAGARAATVSGAATAPYISDHPRLPHYTVSDYDRLPIHFEPNIGQAPAPIEYFARVNGYAVALTQQAAILNLRQSASRLSANPRTRAYRAAASPGAQLRLRPVHVRAKPQLRGEQQQRSVSNYFMGNDPSKWHSNVANFAAVRYEHIYSDAPAQSSRHACRAHLLTLATALRPSRWTAREWYTLQGRQPRAISRSRILSKMRIAPTRLTAAMPLSPNSARRGERRKRPPAVAVP
ncbi:MAG TPA: hypothetical protein VGD54_00550 [Steroidobacteraceae bacterium]